MEINPEQTNPRVEIFLHDNIASENKILLRGGFKLVSCVSAPSNLVTLEISLAIGNHNEANLKTIEAACDQGFPLRLSGKFNSPTMISNFDGKFQITHYEQDDSPKKVVTCKFTAKQLIHVGIEDPLTYLQSLAVEYVTCKGAIRDVVIKQEALFKQIMYLLIADSSIMPFTEVAGHLSQEQIDNRTISKHYAEIQRLREWISQSYYKQKK